MANNLFQTASEKQEKEKPYEGILSFTNKTISSSDTTILLNNVTKFEKYGLKNINRITLLQLAIAGAVFLGSFFFMPWGIFTLVIAGLVLYAGIKERMRPDLYGLTIELTSGSQHHFLSKDLEGIKKLFAKIAEIVEREAPMHSTFEFHNNKVIHKGDTYNIADSKIGAVGHQASATVSYNDNKS